MNDSGDFQMHSEPDVYGWALCEEDNVRIGPDIDKEVEMEDSEAVAWWQSVLLDLGYLLGKLGPLGVSFPQDYSLPVHQHVHPRPTREDVGLLKED